MSLRARRAALTALMTAAIVGGVLVITADDSGPALQQVITAEGLATRIPEGWEAVDGRPFEFTPPGSAERGIDRWTVARACGPNGCAPRSIEQWLALGEDLETFVTARADEGELLFEVEDVWSDDARILRAVTSAGAHQVFVAAFTDGADFYVECGATQFGGRDRVDALIDVCLATSEAE